MNDQSAELAQAAAFTPEQMARLLFSVKAVMEQQQVLADFQLETVKFFRLLDKEQQAGFTALEQAIIARREN